MKGISLKALVILPVLVSMTSCSWISSRRTLFNDDKADGAKDQAVQTVPKEQYDQLLKKYESLVQGKRLESAKGEDAKQLVNEMEQGQPQDPSALVDQLGKVKGEGEVKPELVETVDVFGRNGLVSKKPGQNAIIGSKDIPGHVVEEQIKKLRKAKVLMDQNKFDAALGNIKELEVSPIDQIRVRAKYMLGEILFRQQEYDLSMQVFEEILQKDAFSSVVLNALGRLIVCSEKLKLKKKQETYHSMLHDFFEAK